MNVTYIDAPAGSNILVELNTDQFGNPYPSLKVDELREALKKIFPLANEVIITEMNIENLSVVAPPISFEN